MTEVALWLKMVAIVETPGTPTQVRQVLVSSGLRGKMEAKITALAAADPQTGVPTFEFKLKIGGSKGGRIQVYPKLSITVDTTRTVDQLLNALEEYWDDLKNHIRVLVTTFPSTSIVSWHVHRGSGDVDEVEL